jgi:hypothetical protein
MIITGRYWVKKADGFLYIASYDVNICPICGEMLVVIGSRKRKVIGSTGVGMILIIRRLRCKECHAIHHELPDMVIPYKRHCAETVEKIIGGQKDGLPCEESTIRRIRAWWAVCRLYFESVLVSLREKYGMFLSAKSAPRKIVRAVANANLWVHTRSALLSG